MLGKLSAAWARMELVAAAVLAVAVTGLILLNVVTRSLGAALFWTDELAIYAMVWMTFLGASAAVHHGSAVAVTILTDALPPALQKVSARLVDLIVLVFALLMVWFCWLWFAPHMLLRAGFDTEVFQGETFNFIYSEQTTTLGIRKVWVWIVVWLFSAGMTLHGVANLFRPAIRPNMGEIE
ncbi:MAG: TRAP transporter small permease [Marivita sp.]|uniref:TRAP transporter small permease n=1 Tax=Marivita sp. TaxID=2003365 RepID=UPI0025BF5059|nr:TRAP transporter small permease [Marivita sp.]MCI5112290.1 TRAP transporter small permease [Marivita sp.]